METQKIQTADRLCSESDSSVKHKEPITTSHPLINSLVLSQILKYFPSNQLKDFRFVSKIWNEEALRVLSKRQCWIALNDKDIAKNRLYRQLKTLASTVESSNYREYLFKRLEMHGSWLENKPVFSNMIENYGKYLNELRLCDNFGQESYEFSPAFFNHLASIDLSNLTSISFDGIVNFHSQTDAFESCLQSLSKSLKTLKLNVECTKGCYRLKIACEKEKSSRLLSFLNKLPNLEFLMLRDCPWSIEHFLREAELLHEKNAHLNLKKLVMMDYTYYSFLMSDNLNEDYGSLLSLTKYFPNLTLLHWDIPSSSQIKFEDKMKTLSKFKKLEDLFLGVFDGEMTSFDDLSASLTQIEKFPKLRKLDILMHGNVFKVEIHQIDPLNYPLLGAPTHTLDSERLKNTLLKCKNLERIRFVELEISTGRKELLQFTTENGIPLQFCRLYENVFAERPWLYR